MVLWEPARVWIWMERTKKRVSWLGVLIEQWTWGLKQLGPWAERFSNKRSPISRWVKFSKNLQYIQTSIRVVSFSNFCGKKNSYSWGFTSTLVHSIATWLPKMQVLQIGMTNWPILTWWRGSSSWMPSVPWGKKGFLKSTERYPFYHVLSFCLHETSGRIVEWKSKNRQEKQ